MTRLAANPLIRTALSAAITAHKAGELDTAEARYLKILKSAPQEFDALTLLGTLLCQRKAFQKGLEYLRMALRLRPQSLNLTLIRDFVCRSWNATTKLLKSLKKA